MSGFIELSPTRGQGRGPMLINVEAIDRIYPLFLEPNSDEQRATVLHLRNGAGVYVTESYEEVIELLRRDNDVFRPAVQDDVT